MSELASKKCVPCRGGVPPLTTEQINTMLGKVVTEAMIGECYRVLRRFAD